MAASPLAWGQMQLTSTTGLVPLETLSTGKGRNLTTRGIASGLKLGDEAILHAGITADVGYDTNVFYGSAEKGSAVLHVGPRIEITNAERGGAVPSGTYYDLGASVDFVQYLTNDSTITNQNAINPSVGGTAEFSSAVSFTLSDTFSRYQQAPYAISTSTGKLDPITRDSNMAAASLRFAPGGGRLRIMLRYTNLLDKYEAPYDAGSNMGNEGILDIGWRWLPKTTIFMQVAQGAITYLNSNSGRSASYPLRTLLGLRGLLTEKLGLNVSAGYSNAFYSSGSNPSGLGNLGVVTELNYTLSVLSRLGVGYHHDFVNSPFIGQYYNMDAIYAAYQQMVASRVLTYLFARYENRRFGPVLAADGVTTVDRTDNYLLGGVSIDYIIGSVFLMGASYSVNLNRTSDTAALAGGFGYTKQVLLFRLGLVY
jgi:hypothetical protein